MALNITKSNEVMEVKHLTTTIYSQPGLGKTSLAFTASNPLLLDFDQGAYRAVERGDVVQVEKSHSKNPFLVKMVVVEKGDDSADDELVIIATPGSIAVTRDVILADRLAQKGLVVLDDRGGVFTSSNVKERLSVRNMMSELREYNIYVEKTKPMGPKEVQLFANALDREISKIVK